MATLATFKIPEIKNEPMVRPLDPRAVTGSLRNEMMG